MRTRLVAAGVCCASIFHAWAEPTADAKTAFLQEHDRLIVANADGSAAIMSTTGQQLQFAAQTPAAPQFSAILCITPAAWS